VSEPIDQSAIYETVGGRPFFERLVGAFYERVETDPVLRPMYPQADLTAPRERLTQFLEQYWGGPTTYSDKRGHPRLRMRHHPFVIDDAASDIWLTHMRAALDEQNLAPEVDELFWRYFTMAAPSMINTFPAQ
jgi:hemoglobin